MNHLPPTAGSAVRWIHERAASLGLDYSTIKAATPDASYQRIVNYFTRDTLSIQAVGILAPVLKISEGERLALYEAIANDKRSRQAGDAAVVA